MNIIIHGFNVHDPEESVGKLKPYLKDHFMFLYGWFGVLSVLFRNRSEAKNLKHSLDENVGSNVFAHSNGCAIAVEAARKGASIKALICINPALKQKTTFPKSIEQIIVIHTKHDVPTRAARLFDSIPFIQILAPNAWGAMGAYGSKSDDKRVKNIDLSDYLKGHSDFFESHNLKKFMPMIKAELNK